MLQEHGYVTFKVYDSVSDIRELIQTECKQFPEYVHPVELYVLGGFSGFGNPSSFHNPAVRKVRYDVYQKSKMVLSEVYPDRNIEVLYDRLMVRKSGCVPSKESWHRDITPNIDIKDVIFGGWINLDDRSNYFSCIPCSHLEKQDGPNGFAKISKTSAEYSTLNKRKQKIEVKPGYCILFFQNILHEVLSQKLSYDSYRVFNSIRITDSKEPLYNKLKIMELQAVPPLPSFQIPPMYAKLHWTNWLEKIKSFSNMVVPICRESRERKSDKSIHTVVQQHMKSLKEYNMSLYLEYTEEETKIYLPHPL